MGLARRQDWKRPIRRWGRGLPPGLERRSGCGAATCARLSPAARRAAFGAPLTGAFYAFELIMGTYTPFGLAPVGAAAVSGILVSKVFGGSGEFLNQMALKSALSQTDMGLLLLLGIICALFGVRMMRAVSLVERICGRIGLPRALQPAIG